MKGNISPLSSQLWDQAIPPKQPRLLHLSPLVPSMSDLSIVSSQYFLNCVRSHTHNLMCHFQIPASTACAVIVKQRKRIKIGSLVYSTSRTRRGLYFRLCLRNMSVSKQPDVVESTTSENSVDREVKIQLSWALALCTLFQPASSAGWHL